jgi:hypothetical protein
MRYSRAQRSRHCARGKRRQRQINADQCQINADALAANQSRHRPATSEASSLSKPRNRKVGLGYSVGRNKAGAEPTGRGSAIFWSAGNPTQRVVNGDLVNGYLDAVLRRRPTPRSTK